MRNIARGNFVLRYLPCLEQYIDGNCGIFSVVNLLLYCLSESNQMDIPFFNCTLKNGLSAQSDSDMRHWFSEYIVGGNTETLKQQIIRSLVPAKSYDFPVKLWCLCQMPYSGRMIECDVMHSRRKGVWVHERCLQLPWPVLQDKRFTDPLFQDRDTFYVAPSTYAESLVWPATLDTKKVERKFTKLRDHSSSPVRYLQWRDPLSFDQCLQLYRFQVFAVERTRVVR